MTDWFTEKDVKKAARIIEARHAIKGFSFREHARITARKVLSAVRPNEWRTIESAPKDGTEIFATDGEHTVIVFWEFNMWVSSEHSTVHNYLTKWMPIPTLPEAE